MSAGERLSALNERITAHILGTLGSGSTTGKDMKELKRLQAERQVCKDQLNARKDVSSESLPTFEWSASLDKVINPDYLLQYTNPRVATIRCSLKTLHTTFLLHFTLCERDEEQLSAFKTFIRAVLDNRETKALPTFSFNTKEQVVNCAPEMIGSGVELGCNLTISRKMISPFFREVLGRIEDHSLWTSFQ